MKSPSQNHDAPITVGSRIVNEFVRAVEETEKPLKGTIKRIVGNEHDAEDILQETVLRAWRYLGNLQNEAKFDAWFSRIARNRVKSHSQKETARKEALERFSQKLKESTDKDPVVTGPELDPSSICEEEDLLLSINESIQKLPEDCREIYFCYFMLNFTLEELVEKFGLHVNTIRNRVQKADDFLERHFR